MIISYRAVRVAAHSACNNIGSLRRYTTKVSSYLSMAKDGSLMSNAKDGSHIDAWWPQSDCLTTRQTFKGYVQPKLDGFRGIADLSTGIIYARDGQEIQSGSPIQDSLEILRKSVKSNIRFLEGQLMELAEKEEADDANMAKKDAFEAFCKGQDPSGTLYAAENVGISFNVFDAVDDSPFAHRHELLRNAFDDAFDHADNLAMRLVPTEYFELEGTVNDLKETMEQHSKRFAMNNYEGAVLRLDVLSASSSAVGNMPGAAKQQFVKFHFFSKKDTLTDTAVRAKNTASFEDARHSVQKLGFKTQREFHAWCKNNSDQRAKLGLPYNPPTSYAKNGWVDWYDFLGNKDVAVRAKDRASFEDARFRVQELGFNGSTEYYTWCKHNPDEKSKLGLPSNPNKVYAHDGWVDWYDFLGNTDMAVRAQDVASFEHAKRSVQALGVKGAREFRAWCKNNPDQRMKLGLPFDPNKAYVNQGWIDWHDFFGNTDMAVRAKDRAGFEEAKRIVQELGFQSAAKYRAWCKTNADHRRKLGLPSHPYKSYANDGWAGWHDFLGNKDVAVRAKDAASFEDARRHAQFLGLKSARGYKAWCKNNPKNRVKLGLPSHPDKIYANAGWSSWSHFLGTCKLSA